MRVLADSVNSFFSWLEVYTGKKESTEKNLGAKDLTRDFQKKWHKVFFDTSKKCFHLGGNLHVSSHTMSRHHASYCDVYQICLETVLRTEQEYLCRVQIHGGCLPWRPAPWVLLSSKMKILQSLAIQLIGDYYISTEEVYRWRPQMRQVFSLQGEKIFKY